MNKKSIAALFSPSVVSLPIIISAAVVAPCEGPNCGFNDLMVLANNIIHFLMFDVSIPLVVIGLVFSWAKLILNQDKEGAWNEAKGSFESIAIGFAIMLGSYVLIKVILSSFLNTDKGFMLFLLN